MHCTVNYAPFINTCDKLLVFFQKKVILLFRGCIVKDRSRCLGIRGLRAAESSVQRTVVSNLVGTEAPRPRAISKKKYRRTQSKHLRPTQPSTLSGTENEYRPKCGDTLRLGSKGTGRYGSFHLWINVRVAGKAV